MSYLLPILIALPALYLLRLVVQNNRLPRRLGHADGRLAPLTGRPNAVSSQTDIDQLRVDPLPFRGDLDATRAALCRAIEAFGGASIVTDEPDYLHAVFTTPRLHFHDDVEFLLDTTAEVVHVRSQSRTGRSDFGTNRRRVKRLATLYQV